MDTSDDRPKFRYTAALANEIEHRWQDRWESEHVFWTPNQTGLLAEDPRGLAARPALFVLDMFPYPSGMGLHVGHPLGYIATDVYARFQRMNGLQRAARDGVRRVRLAGRAVRGADGSAPARHDRAEHRDDEAAAARAGPGARPAAAVRPPPTSSYYRWTQWIFLQIYNSWYDEDADRARPIS